ncbi:MAG: hypothetical protein IT186_20595 [Acidobacteria bacterium]|nr:hypothetical protein [Acidobacteriota bacterium]
MLESGGRTVGDACHGVHPLKVGLLLDRRRLLHWQAMALRAAEEAGAAKVSLLILNRSGATRRTVRERVRTIAYSLYFRLDRQLTLLLTRRQPDVFTEVEAKDVYPYVPVFEVKPEQTKHSDHFPKEALEKLRSAELDVILRFGFRILRGEVLRAAKFGIWSLHHGDNREYRGGPPQFWEMSEESRVMGVTLQVLTEKLDDGVVIERALMAANPLLLHLNRSRAYMRGAEMLSRALVNAYESGEVHVVQSNGGLDPGKRAGRLYKTPSNQQTVSFALQRGRAFGRRLHEITKGPQDWVLGIRRLPSHDPVVPPRPGRYRMVIPPAGHFYADPFLYEWKGTLGILFEDYVRSDGKGRIGWATLDGDGAVTASGTALETPFHLSFPFLFEWGRDLYMIPEMAASGSIRAFRCVEFPVRWEPAGIILESARLVDAAIARHEGRLWLFASGGWVGTSNSDQLWIFHSESLEGPWVPHRRNPVVADVRTARAAGALFWSGAQLVRPAQDNSRRYGGSVVFNAIRSLTESDFIEEPLARMGPDWAPGLIGTHTYSRAGEFEAVDGLAFRRDFPPQHGK